MNSFFIHRRRVLTTLVAPGVVAALAGCATQPGSDADRAALVQRATEYWQLAVKNDRLKQWEYEAPSKDGSMTVDGYLKRGGINYHAVEVTAVRDIRGDEAHVELRMRYSIPVLRMKNQEGSGPDEWRRIDGQWYHVLRRSSAFPDDKGE